MILGMLGNVALGSGLKILGHTVGSILSMRHQQKMAVLNAPTERIVALQGGEDKADGFTKHTRRFLAFLMLTTFCYVILHHVVFQPDLNYRILIPSDPSWFSGIFTSTTKEETVTISAGSLLWRYFNLIEVIIGFYFTKVGK